MTTVRHSDPVLVGFTQASRVIFWVRSREAASATVTMSLTPSNDSEPPNLPFGDHVAPEIEPLLPLPEASRSVVPLPASNEYSATGALLPVRTRPSMRTCPMRSSDCPSRHMRRPTACSSGRTGAR